MLKPSICASVDVRKSGVWSSNECYLDTIARSKTTVFDTLKERIDVSNTLAKSLSLNLNMWLGKRYPLFEIMNISWVYFSVINFHWTSFFSKHGIYLGVGVLEDGNVLSICSVKENSNIESICLIWHNFNSFELVIKIGIFEAMFNNSNRSTVSCLKTLQNNRHRNVELFFSYCTKIRIIIKSELFMQLHKNSLSVMIRNKDRRKPLKK